MAVDVLTAADGRAKAALSRSYAAQWQAARANSEDVVIGNVAPPDQLAHPATPALLEPRDVSRRKPGSEEGRIAILHVVAHIELNAVNLQRISSPALQTRRCRLNCKTIGSNPQMKNPNISI